MRFAKGHGTGNDFVILPDYDGELDLSAELVARICDRHFGIGADGVLRVVRTAAVSAEDVGPAEAAVLAGAGGPVDTGQAAEWFMDYRNADGSMAEMCGNGVRVFAKYLIEQGMAAGPELLVATRSGTRTVCAVADGQFSVDMGGAAVLSAGEVMAGDQLLAGLAISVGNPHLACMISQPVTAVDLTAPSVLAPAELTAGANVEVVRIVGDHEIEMRVHERGSGLTLSCGTGAVAAAVAAAVSAGEWQREEGLPWTVHVPGGTLSVSPSPRASLLAGPAEIVASGELAGSWLAGLSPAALASSS
jgi:diaminopimelate epimerase